VLSSMDLVREYGISETGSVFALRWGEGDTCSVGSLRKN
jgi:hypothetical protein